MRFKDSSQISRRDRFTVYVDTTVDAAPLEACATIATGDGRREGHANEFAETLVSKDRRIPALDDRGSAGGRDGSLAATLSKTAALTVPDGTAL